MPFTVEFQPFDKEKQATHVELTQKITAIDAEIVKLSDARADYEAAYRAKENFLRNEKGKLEIQLRGLLTATLVETP